MFDLSEIVGGVALSGVVIAAFWFLTRRKEEPLPPREPSLPPLPKQDFTLDQLRPYDGVQQGRRILLAMSGHVYDVSARSDFYGPEGPYGALAGRDAGRALATMSLDADGLREGHDDLSDLSPMERSTLSDWENQFKFRYPVVGKLLKPGEEPTDYASAEEKERLKEE